MKFKVFVSLGGSKKRLPLRSLNMAEQKVTRAAEETQSIKDYSDKFDTWVATVTRAMRNGREDFDSAINNQDLTFNQIVDRMQTAWDVTINFLRTEIRSGRSSARRMAVNRGVDHRQFHPAQLRNKKTAADEVSKALED
jgi:hypothetical protein